MDGTTGYHYEVKQNTDYYSQDDIIPCFIYNFNEWGFPGVFDASNKYPTASKLLSSIPINDLPPGLKELSQIV